MDWNDDYLDFLDALIAEEVELVIVGAFLGRDALLANKRATGRAKDAPDVALLDSAARSVRGGRKQPSTCTWHEHVHEHGGGGQ